MPVRTKMLFIKITETFNKILPAFYEDALPTAPLYCVINNPVVSSISDQGGDLVAFYVDIYSDDKICNSAEQLEEICESLRNELDKSIITDSGNFGGHLNFEKQFSTQESEFDINHRRQEWTARVFYNR